MGTWLPRDWCRFELSHGQHGPEQACQTYWVTFGSGDGSKLAGSLPAAASKFAGLVWFVARLAHVFGDGHGYEGEASGDM